MNCPVCDGELKCAGGKRIKWRTLRGKSRTSRSIRTKYTRTWVCKACERIFTLLGKYKGDKLHMVISEVELAN